MNVPPTSTPSLAVLSVVDIRDSSLRYEISNRVRPHYTDVTDALKSVPSIARSSVEDRVAETLRNLIVTGELAEGTPLVQRDLAERLGVSQTPVRLGLVELERAGLVEVGDTGRASVTRLSREDFEEISAARLGLEGLAARLGAAAVGPAELAADARGSRGSSSDSAAQADVDGYLRARWAFHAACYEASGRTRLVAEVERLFWRSERYNRLVLSTKERFRRSVGNYRRFYEACKTGDPRAAQSVIRESIAVGGRPDLGRAALGARVRRIGADVGGTFTDVVLQTRTGGSASRRCSRRRPPTTAPSSTPCWRSAAPPRSCTGRRSRRTPCSSTAARARRS